MLCLVGWGWQMARWGCGEGDCRLCCWNRGVEHAVREALLRRGWVAVAFEVSFMNSIDLIDIHIHSLRWRLCMVNVCWHPMTLSSAGRRRAAAIRYLRHLLRFE
jgi:hypothetical protein